MRVRTRAANTALYQLFQLFGPLALIGCQRDRGAGGLAADVAFPVVANLAALDEFRCDRSDQQVVAMRAAFWCGEGASAEELRPMFMKLHVTASFPFSLWR